MDLKLKTATVHMISGLCSHLFLGALWGPWLTKEFFSTSSNDQENTAIKEHTLKVMNFQLPLCISSLLLHVLTLAAPFHSLNDMVLSSLNMLTMLIQFFIPIIQAFKVYNDQNPNYPIFFTLFKNKEIKSQTTKP